MKRITAFLASLRGKLILTYTLVTVLALLALELVLFLTIVFAASVTNTDRSDYLSDVIYLNYPRVARYLQPNATDLKGLQSWVNQTYASGYVSIAPTSWFDSPAAALVRGQPFLAVAPDRTVLAQAPQDSAIPVGNVLVPPSAAGERVLANAFEGTLAPLELYTPLPDGNYWVAVPILQDDFRSPVVGALVMTVAPPPPLILTLLPVIFGTVVVTGIVLLILVAPFGALFGFFMSRGLTRRLTILSAAADAMSEGHFDAVPQDRSGDEIGRLSMRMRRMAERIQALLRSQQELAMLQERNRIARELHDTVKQQNFATLMQLRTARNRMTKEPAAALEALEQAERLVKNSQQELGTLILELRPVALEELGLVNALQDYMVTWSRQSCIAATFDAADCTGLNVERAQTLYRVAQEALANVARHSQATAVHVTVACSAAEVTLTVVDNGVGFDPNAAHGFGLNTMQERLAAAGGSLQVSSILRRGTTCTARIPLGDVHG